MGETFTKSLVSKPRSSHSGIQDGLCSGVSVHHTGGVELIVAPKCLLLCRLLSGSIANHVAWTQLSQE